MFHKLPTSDMRYKALFKLIEGNVPQAMLTHEQFKNLLICAKNESDIINKLLNEN